MSKFQYLLDTDRNRQDYWFKVGKKDTLTKGQCNPTKAHRLYRDDYMDGYRAGMDAWWDLKAPRKITLIQRIRRWVGLA